MGYIIGVDLGTSTTEVAVLQEGKPVLLLNFDGNMVTPSVVGIDESGNYMVGEKAKAQLILRPERTIGEVKRKIGTDEVIQLGKEKLTPVEVSAQILSYVKRYASAALEEEITEAVISVPAYFNEIQRRATVEAGKLAGLTVKRIINEPTAAALSYGLNRLEEESIVMVYDLGGGTFDVTLLEMFDGVLEVKASSGDNQLGGKDFDECLIQWFLDCFEKKNKINLKNDAIAMAKLKDEAEKCKIALSSNPSYQVNLPMLKVTKSLPYSLEETITVEQFEAMIAPYIERTHQPIRRVLADSNITPEEIDYILLVGGSTRISLVKRDIQEFLGKEPVSAVHPDYAVAEGAAIQAGIISGMLKQEESIIMTDVNPFSLGISALEGFMKLGMSVIIPRNTTIPVTKEEVYFTSYDGQTEADIEVYQGESNRVEENQFLGKFRMSGIPKNQGGKEALKVLFSYNVNGMLHVEAKVLSTGEKASIQIDLTGVKGALNYDKEVDVSGWDKKSGARKYRSTIRQSEKLVKQLEEKEEIESLIYLLKKAILSEDEVEAEELEAELLDILRKKSEN